MEIWKVIPSTNGFYQVSNLGRVRSLDRIVKHNYGGNKKTKGRVLKQSFQRNGYLACGVFFNGKEKRVNVHRLVALCFLGESELQVNHKDGIKSNNCLDNLEYCTDSENKKHAYKLGLYNIDGENHNQSIFTNLQAIEIFKRANNGDRTGELAKEFNTKPSTISNIKKGRAYSAVTKHKGNPCILR